MGRPKAGWTDQQTEEIIGNLLRGGVFLSAAVVLVGGILYLLHYGADPPHHTIFRGEPSELRTIPGTVKDALAVRSRGIIQLGILLLIATPVARVAFSIYAFARERDWLYVGVTLVVFAVLMYSLISGYV